MHRKLAVFTKEGNFGALGVTILPQGQVMASYDSRHNTFGDFVPKVFAAFDTPDFRSFESQLEHTVDNGWKVIYLGDSPNQEQVRLN